MEARNWIIAIACATLIIACSLLAYGWKRVAEDARAAEQACIATGRVRVFALPRIDIGEVITYRDRVIAETNALVRGNATVELEEMLEQMDRESRGRTPCEAYNVCLDHLVALRFAGDVDIRAVQQVVTTAWTAGFDVVLRPQHDQRTW